MQDVQGSVFFITLKDVVLGKPLVSPPPFSCRKMQEEIDKTVRLNVAFRSRRAGSCSTLKTAAEYRGLNAYQYYSAGFLIISIV